MQPNPQQAEIVRFATEEDGHGVVNANAGTGKTTTLRMVIAAVAGNAAVVSFGRSVADELARRMPPNARCNTIHGFGLGAWNCGIGKADRAIIDGGKSTRIIRWLQSGDGRSRGYETIPRWLSPRKVRRVVSLAKNEGLVPSTVTDMVGLAPDDQETWETLLDHHGIETDDRTTPDLLIGAAREVLKVSADWGHRIVDQDDMLYLPALSEGVVFPRFRWVAVDELQDVSRLQRVMVLRMVEHHGRFLGVGDRHQAIYGWRGADSRSMDAFVEATSARELPLSVCRRCPRAVLKLAQEVAPEIEAAPGAPEGVVEELEHFRLKDVKPGDLVICRNRAPMVAVAYKLLGAGLPVRVIGAQVGEAIVARIEGFECEYVEDMVEKLDRWVGRVVARARKREDEEAAAEALDVAGAIRAVVEGMPNVEKTRELCARLSTLFGKPEADMVLVGTIHGVKGLEAPVVWFVDRHLIPSRAARQDWQKVQEQNLFYVGVTRSMRELYFVTSDSIQ